MTKIVDPIQEVALAIEERRVETATTRRIKKLMGAETAGAREDVATYEMQLVPPPGAKLMQLTCGATYRTPIPVQYDPATRTCYPIMKA